MTSSVKVAPVGLEYVGTAQRPLIDGSLAVSSAHLSTSGPFGSIGTVIISTPKLSVIAKWRSYPGAGQRNLIGPSFWPHGFSESGVPCSRPKTVRSCMSCRLELPNAMRFAGSTARSSPKMARSSGRPATPP